MLKELDRQASLNQQLPPQALHMNTPCEVSRKTAKRSFSESEARRQEVKYTPKNNNIIVWKVCRHLSQLGI